MGHTFPDGPTRVSMYVEALQIVRQLFETGQCAFTGDHYRELTESLLREQPAPVLPPQQGGAR